MKVGQRREREIAHARTDIVEAAIRAFERTGLRNTTMQDIAREAGYTAASLYTYFKSKQEIIDAMVTLLTDEFIQVFDQPVPSGLSFRQRFEMVLHRQLELIDKRHNIFVGFLSDHTNESMCASDEAGRAFHENFERTGLRNTTMQDLAREAGYTAASLYTYFKSKQEIIDAMVSLLTDEFIQVFDQPVPSGLSFRQRFEMVLHRQLELIDKRHNIFVGFLSDHTNESMCAGDEAGRAFHENFERRISRLASWLKENAKSDDIGGYPPELLARTLFGMAFGLVHRWGAEEEHEPFIKFSPLIADLFFFGVSGKFKPGARKK